MENPIFDELSFQIFKKKWKVENRIFLNFVHLFEKGVSQFEAKGQLFSSLKFFYCIFCLKKSRRDVKNKKIGVSHHGESDFPWIIFSNFWKQWKVENRIFCNFVHLFEKGVSQFEAKGRHFSRLKYFFCILLFTESRRDVENKKNG